MSRKIKLCLLGDSNVGKTSLVSRFASDFFNEHAEATIGASFISKTLQVDDQSVKFQIWDTAGAERYRGLTPLYYRGAAAALLVYDVTKLSTFKTLTLWIDELKQFGPQNIVVAIAGNKCDLEEREVPTEEAVAYADEIGALFLETSAKTGKNVKNTFVRICRQLPSEKTALGTSCETIALNNGSTEEENHCYC
ncbi:ras-related protein Rab-22A-like [Oscarella lobularis]|uniref:ras-related protein Rab-22A-like n=1 Tax=Oscarella lobularis TaxID=121494 RepID=UPI00331348C2